MCYVAVRLAGGGVVGVDFFGKVVYIVRGGNASGDDRRGVSLLTVFRGSLSVDESFDAYHKWLGIPPEEQPADYYRLLGLTLLESDPDVISSAADQRMLYLRGLQTGPHAEHAHRLLNEVSGARVCLLDREQKAVYDAGLASRRANRLTPPPPEPMAVDVAREETARAINSISRVATAKRQAHGEVTCPKCAEKMPWNVAQAGRGVTCPRCRSGFPMPERPPTKADIGVLAAAPAKAVATPTGQATRAALSHFCQEHGLILFAGLAVVLAVVFLVVMFSGFLTASGKRVSQLPDGNTNLPPVVEENGGAQPPDNLRTEEVPRHVPTVKPPVSSVEPPAPQPPVSCGWETGGWETGG